MLTCQKTDYFDSKRTTCFYFEDYYLHQGSEIIKENCTFARYLNNTNITLAVLDGGNESILVNWPSDEHIEQHVMNQNLGYLCILQSIWLLSITLITELSP